MRHLTSSLAGALALALLSASVAHAQATIDDCEKIQAADAYNQCLAKFGPTSKVKSVEPVKPGDIKDSSAEAAAGGGKTRAAAAVDRHGRGHGRVAARHGGKGAKVAKAAGRSKGATKTAAKASAKHGGRKRMAFTVTRRHK